MTVTKPKPALGLRRTSARGTGSATAIALLTAAALAAGTLAGRPAQAHEIPNDVTVRIIVQRAGDELNVLVRAPLEAMQDIEFPTTGPGYLVIGQADTALRNAADRWLAGDIHLYASGRPLPRLALKRVRASIPSDRSFTDFDSALAHINGPRIASNTRIVWQQVLLDAWLTVPVPATADRIAVLPDLDRLGLEVAVAIRSELGDSARVYQLVGEPERIELDPRWHQAALRFVDDGFRHILDGRDHLLFLLCLVLPFRRDVRRLIWVVTAFTVAHSITLTGSAFGITPTGLWFPPLVETLIAASIFYMALENVVTQKARARWMLAFAFGLVHGFGFSFALENTMQFAGDHVLLSLLSFNIGVELGQLLVLAILLPVLALLFRFVVAERIGIIVISVLAGHTAWHWMLERYDDLSQFPLSWLPG